MSYTTYARPTYLSQNIANKIHDILSRHHLRKDNNTKQDKRKNPISSNREEFIKAMCNPKKIVKIFRLSKRCPLYFHNNGGIFRVKYESSMEPTFVKNANKELSNLVKDHHAEVVGR